MKSLLYRRHEFPLGEKTLVTGGKVSTTDNHRRWRNLLTVSAAAIIMVCIAAPARATGLETGSPEAGPEGINVEHLIEVADREGSVPVIVVLARRSDQDTVADSVNPDDATVLHTFEHFPLLTMNVNSDALRDLAASRDVVGIQEDGLRAPSLAVSVPWIGADYVHGAGATGSGSAVAVLDTGIDRDHPFFANRIVDEACFSDPAGSFGGMSLCPNGGTVQTGAGAADAETERCLYGHLCDHGSHVAGIAAGSGAGAAPGVAPGARIVAIQVFHRRICGEDDGQTPKICIRAYDHDIIRALEYVYERRATLGVAAVNLSLGGGRFKRYCDGDEIVYWFFINELLKAGIPTVIAAGNAGFEDAVGSPGCIENAITVGNTDNEDQLAPNTNRGRLLDLFAPGVRINSSVVDPDDSPSGLFAAFSGTSMSAPHVSGALAVLREAFPAEPVTKLIERLRNTGPHIEYYSRDDSGNDIVVSQPRIDLMAAYLLGP